MKEYRRHYTSTGKYRKQTSLWTMKDGNKIRICDMDDEHLAHALTFLEGIAKHKELETILFYMICPPPHGDMANDCFEREIDSLAEADWRDYVPDCYWDLTIEYERRKGMNKTFFIAGVQHHPGMKEVIKDLEVGNVLDLVPDPENKFDPNAVRIEYKGNMLGFVPKKFSSEVVGILDVAKVECLIKTLDPTAKPWEQCLVTVSVVEEN